MLPQDHSTKSRNHSGTAAFAVANGSEHSPILGITQRHKPPQISVLMQSGLHDPIHTVALARWSLVFAFPSGTVSTVLGLRFECISTRETVETLESI
jgi:hypothetical protein